MTSPIPVLPDPVLPDPALADRVLPKLPCPDPLLYPFARDYHSPQLQRRAFPSLRFYWGVVKMLYRAGKLAKQGKFTEADFAEASTGIGQSLEKVGARIEIEGYNNIFTDPEPCVFIANHMSTLETFLLPAIIQPSKPVNYVIKRSLTKYPFLGPVLLSLKAMIVDQKNPREDLVNILRLGEEQIKEGRSVIIFPQGHRRLEIRAEDFSSLGVKLAKRAGVQMVPIALKTDAWGMGYFKDVGWIRPEKTVHVKFGPALNICGNGKEEQAAAVRFIKENYEQWRLEDNRANQKALRSN